MAPTGDITPLHSTYLPMAPTALQPLNELLLVLQFIKLARVTGADGRAQIDCIGADTRILLLRRGQEVGRQAELCQTTPDSAHRAAFR